jgi:hypothetical protein
MTPNSSLVLTVELQKRLRADLLKEITEDFPFEIVESYKEKHAQAKRDRVYNEETTLLTMLLTAIQEDKSLQQSVVLFKKVFESRMEEIKGREVQQLAETRERDEAGNKKRGRPRLYQSRLPKSKTQTVSANTAAYTKARQRLDYALVKEVFDYSKDFNGLKAQRWHEMETYNTDGTYIQMQDSKELAEKFYVKQNDGAYPQALLQAMVRQGSGQIVCFDVGTRHQSELELVVPLINQLPNNSLVLADDLYNSYAIFALMQHKGCHLIVPGKRKRNYKVIKKLGEGDELVELSYKSTPQWWNQDWKLPKQLTVRRIEYLSADGQNTHVLYTTLTNEAIGKTDIVVKYTSRWEIEITIRELKTLMDINIARSKGEDMVLKEITIALIAYNLIRRQMAKSVEQTEFSPHTDIFQELFALYKNLLVDKKGRVYKRWSPGRYGQTAQAD